MNYHYSMVIQWSEEDRLFLVHLPELPWQQFHTHGRTYEEAAKNGQEVIETFVEMLKRRKQTTTRTKDASYKTVASCVS